MNKHPDCEDRCQILEHKGYHTCAQTGRCEQLEDLSTHPEGETKAVPRGWMGTDAAGNVDDADRVPAGYESERERFNKWWRGNSWWAHSAEFESVAYAAWVGAKQEAKKWSLMPDDLHPTTKQLVFTFAMALADKLYSAEKKYGYSNGWADKHWMDECRSKLREHIEKGDPRDVAAYCAFLWYHKESTAVSKDSQDALVSELRDDHTDISLMHELMQKAAFTIETCCHTPVPVAAVEFPEQRVIAAARELETWLRKVVGSGDEAQVEIRATDISGEGTRQRLQALADALKQHDAARQPPALVTHCPDGQKCGCVTTGCWGECCRIRKATSGQLITLIDSRVVYQCPRCSTSMEIDLTAKPFINGARLDESGKRETTHSLIDDVIGLMDGHDCRAAAKSLQASKKYIANVPVSRRKP